MFEPRTKFCTPRKDFIERQKRNGEKTRDQVGTRLAVSHIKKEEEEMKHVIYASKELSNLSTAYHYLRREYEKKVRAFVLTVEPMDEEAFWILLASFQAEVKERPMSSACHNLIVSQGWDVSARFLSRYRKIQSKLSAVCDKMPDFLGGNDSFSDWIDALPLGGEDLVEGILSGQLATYEQVEDEVRKKLPEWHTFIMSGENYVASTLADKLVDLFSFALRKGHVEID